MSYAPEIGLLLLVLNLGTAFGAGLYETLVVIPNWFHKSADRGYHVDAKAMRDLDSGRKFWAFVTTLPLTLIVLANLIFVWHSQRPAHTWWLSAVLITLVERIGTFTFFIPLAIKLQKADQLATTVITRLVTSWIILNYSRNGLTLIAWLCALRALSEWK